MSELETIDHPDLGAWLEEVLPKRNHFLFAVYGTGKGGLHKTKAAGDVHVVPVTGELEFRREFIKYRDERAVFLVPFPQLPDDVLGSFAFGGKVKRLDREAKLKRLLSATALGRAVVRSELGKHMLAEQNPVKLAVPSSSVVSLRRVWEAWLTTHAKLKGGLALDSLLTWVASADPAPVNAIGAPLLAELEGQLRDHVSPLAPHILDAWLNGRGGDVVALALLAEVEVSDEVAKMWMSLQCKAVFPKLTERERPQMLRDLGSGASSALVTLGDVATKVAQRADDMIDEPKVRASFEDHPRLPSGVAARLRALGAALKAHAKKCTRESFQTVDEAHQRAESHALYGREEYAAQRERIDSAVRLAAWLTVRPEKACLGALGPHSDALRLGSFFANEGGYIDLARTRTRGGGASAIDKGIAAIAKVADDARAELDHTFARSLAAWHASNRPRNEQSDAPVVPIDRALEMFVARFLREDASRKVLVLLIDGLSWGQCVELLDSLADSWAPTLFNNRKGKIPAVFATLPTVTEVSRGAFFKGAPMPNGKRLDTSRHPKFFEAHRALRKECDKPPKLLLRGGSHRPDGSKSEDARKLVANSDRRVVGVVINGVDSALKRDPQQRVTNEVGDIVSLKALLEAARDGGRFVLIASDHGNVQKTPETTRLPGVKDARTRFRTGSANAPGELFFRGEGVYCEKGEEGAVLLTDDRSQYTPVVHAGEHGGAALSEVVAPCVLLGDVTNGELEGNEETFVYPTPRWWLRRVGDAKVVAKSVPKSKSGPLFDVVQPVKRSVVPKRVPKREPEHPLGASAVFRELVTNAKFRQQILIAVEYLDERNGKAALEDVAGALGVPVRRVRGLLSKMLGVLNIDGDPVLSYDANDATLRVELLRQHFEIPQKKRRKR